MICKFCGKPFDYWKSNAGSNYDYCSAICQREAVKAQNEKANANKIAQATRLAAQQNAEAARQQAAAARSAAEASRRAEQAARDQANAYNQMRRSQEQIEANRRQEEHLRNLTQSIQSKARQELDDLRRMFVTKNGLPLREAAGDSNEYRMRTCTVSDFSSDSETAASSKTTCKLLVSSLLNKTPKGSGCLNFRLYYLPDSLKNPFIEKSYYYDYSSGNYNSCNLKGASGYLYWKENPDCKSWFENYGYEFSPNEDNYIPIYESEKFTLRAGENIDNRSFILKRTAKSLAPGSYAMYLVLVETLASTERQIVSYCKVDGLHTVKPASVGSANHDKLVRNIKIYDGSNCIEDGKAKLSFATSEWVRGQSSDYLDDAPGNLYFTMDLTDVESGKKLPAATSSYYKASYDGRLESCSIRSGCRKVFEASVPKKAYYKAVINLFEMDEKGKSRCLGTINTQFAPPGLVLINNKLCTKKADKFNVACEKVSYSIAGKSVSIKIGKLTNKADYATGALKICLEYETHGKRTLAAKFYKPYLNWGESVSNISEKVAYTRPADYCDDSIPIITVYTLNDMEKPVSNSKNDIRFYSITQQAIIAADNKNSAIGKKIKMFTGRMFRFAIPLWFWTYYAHYGIQVNGSFIWKFVFSLLVMLICEIVNYKKEKIPFESEYVIWLGVAFIPSFFILLGGLFLNVIWFAAVLFVDFYVCNFLISEALDLKKRGSRIILFVIALVNLAAPLAYLIWKWVIKLFLK